MWTFLLMLLSGAAYAMAQDCRLSEVPVVERSILTIEETDDRITVKYICDPGYWPKFLPDSVWCEKQVGTWSQLPDLSDGDAGCFEDPDADWWYSTKPRASNNCDDDPCLNNGVCAYNIAAASYICGCPIGYYGTHCEYTECPTSELPIVLHSTLQFPDEGHPLTTYTCNQGYQFPDGSTVQTTECDHLTGVWTALDYDACEPQRDDCENRGAEAVPRGKVDGAKRYTMVNNEPFSKDGYVEGFQMWAGTEQRIPISSLSRIKFGIYERNGECNYTLKEARTTKKGDLTPGENLIEFNTPIPVKAGDHFGFTWLFYGVVEYEDSGAGDYCGDRINPQLGQTYLLPETFTRTYSILVPLVDCGGTCVDVSGLVTDSDNGLPIAGVEIQHASGTYNTDLMGKFSECLVQPLTVTLSANGYITQDVVLNPGNNLIDLTRSYLKVDLQPADKIRLVGQEVTFCCFSMGDNAINGIQYQWFRNGVALSEETGTDLEISNIDLVDAGDYQCKIYTEKQAVFSRKARLEIIEQEKCEVEDFYEPLPEGYLWMDPYDPNETDGLRIARYEINKGRCSSRPICLPTDLYFCFDDLDESCCNPVYNTEEIELEAIDDPSSTLPFSYQKVVGCVCGFCDTQPFILVSGYVTAAASGAPVAGAAILIDGGIFPQTATTNSDGFYVINYARNFIPDDKLIFKVQPNNGASPPFYLDHVTIVDVSDLALEQVEHNIKLPSGQQVTFDSSQTTVLELNSPDSDNDIGNLVIEPNTFYDENGNLYEGEVKATLSIIDTSSEESLLSAPGDFSTVNDDGEEMGLVSRGMLRINFADSNTNSPVSPNGVNWDIPTEDLGPGFNLYTLDEDTGIWEPLRELTTETISKRRRRQSNNGRNVRVILARATLLRWINIDRPLPLCFIKVRTFENSDFLENEQVTGIQVTVVVMYPPFQFGLKTNGVTTGDGVCLKTVCTDGNDLMSDNYGYIRARSRSNVLWADKTGANLPLGQMNIYEVVDDRFIKVSLINLNIPPYYDDTMKRACMEAPFEDAHFRFYNPQVGTLTPTPVTPTPTPVTPTPTPVTPTPTPVTSTPTPVTSTPTPGTSTPTPSGGTPPPSGGTPPPGGVTTPWESSPIFWSSWQPWSTWRSTGSTTSSSWWWTSTPPTTDR